MAASDLMRMGVIGPEFGSEADVEVGYELEAPPFAAVLPAHPYVRALVTALMCAGAGASPAGWRTGESCAQIDARIGLEPMRVRLHALDADTAWREVVALSPLALDVLVILLDRFQTAGAEVLLVRCAEILEAKGLRRWGEERRLLEQQVGREIMRLGRLSVGLGEEPVFQVTPLDDESRFVVALDPEKKAEWARAPACAVSRRILQFDHRNNRGADVLAKKIGLYFSLAGAGSRPVARSVGASLKAIGAHAELSQPGRGGRLADRFEEAVLRLQERGVFEIAYAKAWDRSLGDARLKGWLKGWLAAELRVQAQG
jgi:hypothetical protein